MAYRYTWGLWSVRRSDLQDVWCEGFDFVRPPYPDVPNPERSGQWQDGSSTVYFDNTDNLDSTLNYAYTAQQVGFTKLVYDLGLLYWYQEYRHTVVDPNYGVGNPKIPRSLQDIRTKVSERIGYMSGVPTVDPVTGNTVQLSSIICQPYLDEPDYFAQQRSDVQGPSGPLWTDYIDGVPRLDGQPSAKLYRAALTNMSLSESQLYNAINRDIIAEFKGLVNYAIGVATSHNMILYIATTTPDIVQRCDPANEDCSAVAAYRRDDFAAYHYNSAGTELLMSSIYKEPSYMSKLLPAIRSNYGATAGELINFWDRADGYGELPGAPTAQDLISQINVNSGYTGGENWLYQGDCISFDFYDPEHNVSSLQQWGRLLQAIRSFGTSYRCGP